MNELAPLCAASLCVAVVLGTDVFFTVVGRAALARTSVPAMVETMGRLHEVADRRMPFFGILGIVGALAGVVLASGTRVWAGTALAAQLAWLAVYLTVAKPLNTKMTAAARAGATPDEARAWQDRWESVLVPRSLLMTVAGLALLMAIVAAR